MMKTSKPIIFFGTSQFSVPTLQALIDNRYPVAAVVTKPDAASGRNRRQRQHAVKEVAGAADIPVLQPATLDRLAAELRSYRPALGVVVAFGKLIPATVLTIFQQNVVNIHASLLPKYRGPAPIEAAILHGDKTTGISLMQVVAEMDAGPVYDQQTIPLHGTETKPELYRQLSRQGADFLMANLPRLLQGTLQPRPQDDQQATYTHLLAKADGRIQWEQPASQIERQVRAYLGWPGSYTAFNDLHLAITKAQTIQNQGPPGQPFVYNGQLAIYCGHNALVAERVKPAGKPDMDSRAFLAGYRSKIGLE